MDEKTAYLLQEIKERKRIEKALRKSETVLRQAQAAAHMGSWTWHIKSNRLEWSDEMYRIFGIDKVSFSGDIAEVASCAIHPEDRHIVEQANSLLIHGRKPMPTEYRVVWPDKSEHVIWAEAGEWITDAEGNPIALSGYAQDITARKRAEEERRTLEERLQRSEKMEAMGKLAGGVAHDLNNVLGVVSGYSELLMERIPAGNPLREYAANILKSSEKAAAIIQDLLTLARRGVTITKVIDLNSIVSNLLKTLEFDAFQNYHRAVTFKTDLEKDLLNINGSPVHLEKTVMNLVSNAAEAIVVGGEVNIRTENRYLDKTMRRYDTVREGDYVVLTVSDTGMGIPAADLDKIFEPFYTKKKMDRRSTGLGLSIVWGTVKDHNGYIDVQSAVGSGTTFTLYFPVTREKIGEAAQKIPLEQYMGHGESVLVVDDVEGQRNVASALLQQLGYHVHAVASGEEAVEYLKINKADVMVLDMIMEPGIDGLETYRQIVRFKPNQKAVIVSGFSETERVNEAKLLGAGAYVRKPYVMEKIGLAIRDELNKKKTAVYQQYQTLSALQK